MKDKEEIELDELASKDIKGQISRCLDKEKVDLLSLIPFNELFDTEISSSPIFIIAERKTKMVALEGNHRICCLFTRKNKDLPAYEKLVR